MPSSGKGQERRHTGTDIKIKSFQTIPVFQYFQGKVNKLSKYRDTIYMIGGMVNE